METAITILSYKRADQLTRENKHNTLNAISEMNMKRTFLVVREEEVNEYAKVAREYGCSIFVIAQARQAEFKEFGVKETRQILCDAYCLTTESFVMLDDDLAFNIREKDGKYRRAETKDTDEMFEWLLNVDPIVPLRGIASRAFSNGKPEETLDSNMVHVFALRSSVLISHIHFADCPGRFSSDHWFHLHILASGFHSRLSYRWCKEDKPMAKGGCNALGRTAIQISLSNRGINKAFPECTKLVHREREVGDTLSLNVAWKKAFDLFARRREEKGE